jgi:hypothetical protein
MGMGSKSPDSAWIPACAGMSGGYSGFVSRQRFVASVGPA